VNSLPKTVIRQRRDCDLNPGPSAPESSTVTTWLDSRPAYFTFSDEKKHFNVIITDVSKVQSPITSDEFVNFGVVQFSTAITAAKITEINGQVTVKTSYRPRSGRRYVPADGSSTRGGSTSIRGRVRSPLMAKLQAVSVPVAYRAAAPWDRQTNRSRYRLMSPYGEA